MNLDPGSTTTLFNIALQCTISLYLFIILPLITSTFVASVLWPIPTIILSVATTLDVLMTLALCVVLYDVAAVSIIQMLGRYKMLWSLGTVIKFAHVISSLLLFASSCANSSLLLSASLQHHSKLDLLLESLLSES